MSKVDFSRSFFSLGGRKNGFFFVPFAWEKLSRCTKKLAASGCLMAVLSGCERVDVEAYPFVVKPRQELRAEAGKELSWTFTAEAGKRPLKIVNVTPDRLPLGVNVDFKNQEFVIWGKPLRSINSEGHFIVTVFDEERCRQTITDSLGRLDKIRARFGYRIHGENAMCAFNLHEDNPSFTKIAIFPWFSDQYSDESVRPIKRAMASLASTALNTYPSPNTASSEPKPSSSTRDNIFLVSSLEAPHQGLVQLDVCYAYQMDQCGINTDCVWHSGGCASLSKNNLKLIGK